METASTRIVIDFAPESLTVGEIELLEECAERDFSELMELWSKRQFRARELAAMILVTQRRLDPQYTIEQARSVRFTDIEFAQSPANRADRRAKGRGNPPRSAGGSSKR
jgi:hypothetical protein